MTIKQIQKRLDQIQKASDDEDKAHRLEKQLWCDFIVHASKEKVDPKLAEKAKLVLKTVEIPFSRWYS